MSNYKTSQSARSGTRQAAAVLAASPADTGHAAGLAAPGLSGRSTGATRVTTAARSANEHVASAATNEHAADEEHHTDLS